MAGTGSSWERKAKPHAAFRALASPTLTLVALLTFAAVTPALAQQAGWPAATSSVPRDVSTSSPTRPVIYLADSPALPGASGATNSYSLPPPPPGVLSTPQPVAPAAAPSRPVAAKPSAPASPSKPNYTLYKPAEPTQAPITRPAPLPQQTVLGNIGRDESRLILREPNADFAAAPLPEVPAAPVTLPPPAIAPQPTMPAPSYTPAAPAYVPAAPTPVYVPTPAATPVAPARSKSVSASVSPSRAGSAALPAPPRSVVSNTISDRLSLSLAPGSGALVLGVGDVLAVSVLGQPQLSATVYVDDDGSITVPLAGKVQVAGLSAAEAAKRVGEAYVRGDYLVNPQVNIVLSEFRSQQISVLGEVRNPGRFPVETRVTILDALAQSGGVTELGSDTAYILRRDGSVVVRYDLDLSALLEAGAGQEYFELRAGDTVMVPRVEQFYIYGEVRSPNAYRLRPNTTVMQALSLGGGLTDRGSDRRVEIKRRTADGRLQSLGANLNDLVRADDVIYVKERFF